jgi:transcriptional adapter 2-alpha
MDHISTPIYAPDWGADEEIALLNAIDKYGLGNWGETSQALGTKSEIECEEHYYTFYLQSPVAPLPDNSAPLPPSSGNYTSSTSLYNNGMKQEIKSEYPATARSSSTSTAPATASSDAPDWRKKQLHAESDEDIARWRLQQQDFRAQQKHTLASLVGYLPQRNDFEIEYLNDAEKDIADMEFKAEDTEAERELKLKVLEIYNSVLDARAERKELIERYQLLLKRERRLTKEEREVAKAMRPFSRFLAPHEFDEMVREMVAERALRMRIEQLQVYRMNGVQTLSEGANFDADYNRQQQLWLSKFGKNYVDMCAVPPGQDVEMRAAMRAQVTAASSNNATDAAASSSSSSSSSSGPAPKRAKAAAPSKSGVDSHLDFGPSGGAKEVKLCVCNPTSPGVCAFDISRMEGVQLLSKAEQLLCTELHLIPAHYMVIKERLIRESVAHGFITQGHARNVLKIDINCTDKILNFCISSGLVNAAKQ